MRQFDFINAIYPRRPWATYRFFDAEGRLLYVGTAQFPDARWKAHSLTKRWWRDIARKELVWFDRRFDAMVEESQAIRTESPVYNKAAGIGEVQYIWMRRRGVAYPEPLPWDLRNGDFPGISRLIDEVARDKVELAIAHDGVIVGALIPMDVYEAGCRAMGQPYDPATWERSA